MRYTYSSGNLSAIQRTNNSKTQTYGFTFDAFGNTLTAKVGSKTLSTNTYATGNGQLTKQTYGNGATVSYTYDILGRVKTATYADGRKLTYVYNGEGRLHSLTETNGSNTVTYLYTYDSIGRLIYSEQKENSTSVLRASQSYNTNNQLTSQSWQLGSAAYSQAYTYNSTDGSLNTMTTGTGSTLTMGYDGLRRLTSVSGGPVTRQYTYRDINSTKTTVQVASVTSGGQQYSYTYNNMGNIATYAAPGKGTVTYTYDNQGQLLKAAGDTTYTYTYDGAGNILTASNGTASHSYTYGDSNWKDLLTAFDGQSITYDAIGNPTSYYNGTRWTFTWANGRSLSTASKSGTSLSFAYDADGLRTGKTVDGTTYRYYYASGKLMRLTWGSNTVDFFYDANGTPYAMKYNGTLYYYVTNLQGDVMRVVNASGTVAASYDYDPYGKVISATGTLANINPLRYRGYVYDTETGFYYLQSRYYDPELGRFINADSYTNTDRGLTGFNMFAYCGNNPVMGYDPTGEWSFGTFLGGASLLVTGVTAIAVGVSVMTCGAAAPLMVLVAAVTASAGTLTAVNGAAEIAESVTGYNVVRDGAFGGDSQKYDVYRSVTKTVAEIGTMICGSYIAAKGGNVCFVAGTLVLAATGEIPIEEIAAEDYVWAWDEEAGDIALKRVVETYVNETQELIHLHVNGEEIICTPSHPFYAPVKGWTAAVHLRAGDILVLVNGEYVVVEKVQHEILEAPIAVYNFNVEDYHTYYVASGVLVHNECFDHKANSSKAAVLRGNRQAFLQDSGEYAGQYIARDTAGHGGSAFKLYEKVGNKALRLIGDIGIDGVFIAGKHSSNAGKIYEIVRWITLK